MNILEIIMLALFFIIGIICIISINYKINKKEVNSKNTSKIGKWIEENYKLLFIIIFFIALFLNIYKIGKIPKGFHVDEAGMAYDAYCIGEYGVDRYSQKNPVYFINFGHGQNALYTYLCIPFVKLFGINTISIRMPALILSMLEVVVCYLLAKEKWNKKSALIFMLLVTIAPWHIMKSRWALESYLLSPMFLFSIYGIIKAKKWWHFILVGICFGLTLYTYAMAYIIIPIFLLLTICYMLYIKKIKFKDVVLMGIPIFILALPLMLMILVNNGVIQQVNSFITIPKIPIYRESEINLKNIDIFGKLSSVYFKDKLSYNHISEFGTVYNFAIPFMITGIVIGIYEMVKSIKNKKFDITTIMTFSYISSFIIILMTDTNINRANAIYISSMYMILLGIKFVVKYIDKFKYIIIFCYILGFSLFITKYYFFYYNNSNHILFEDEFVLLVKYLEEDEKYKDKNVYIEEYVQEAWIYELIAKPVSPYDISDIIWKNKQVFGRYYNNIIPSFDDDNGVYIVESVENMKSLEERGFCRQTYLGYNIYYK